jgi:hypothetical protein
MKNNYFNQITSVLSVFGILSLTAFNSFSQCSANAGENVQSCELGSFTLAGSFVATPNTPVLDINQNISNTCMAFMSQTGLAQSFTATSSSICGAGLFFEGQTTGMLIINLWTALPNAGGTLLATGSAMLNNVTAGDVLWNSVPLTIGTTYYLEFATSAPEISTCVSGSTLNAYPGGILYANAGFNEYPNFDYTFRTFTCPASPEVSWEGPNITAGANTTTPTINPPVGVHTYIMTITDPATNCTATDEVTVTVGQPVSSQFNQIALDSYTWNDITYTESGQYVQVLETSLGCDSTVTMVLILNYTNIEDYANTLVSIFPNPTNNLITIEFEAALAQLEVIDAQGKVLQNKTITSGERISLEQEANGIFFIRLTTDQATTVHRVVKQ